jgi:hypothetical protein
MKTNEKIRSHIKWYEATLKEHQSNLSAAEAGLENLTRHGFLPGHSFAMMRFEYNRKDASNALKQTQEFIDILKSLLIEEG